MDRCGGCPLQHVESGAQLAAKTALTRDALERIGGIPPGDYELKPIVPSPKPFRYRRRARLHRGSGGAWGFAGEEGIVPVEQCALFEDPLQKLADALRGIELPGVSDLGLDTSAAGKGAVDLRGPATPGLRRRAEALLGLVKGVTLGSGESLGNPVLSDEYPGFRLRSRPDVFSQANRSGGSGRYRLAPHPRDNPLRAATRSLCAREPAMASTPRRARGLAPAAPSPRPP